MTELSPISHLAPSSNIVDGSVGMLVPNLEAKIVHPETGKQLGYNAEGEIWIKGPNVMLGYLNNDKATKETIDADGFLHTGDIGKCDKKGNWWVVDRIKELIKYKGYQIAPAELEALLLTHPQIADAAVIPTPDKMAGEVPKAYIVLKPDQHPTDADISKFVARKVAPHKKLRGGICFVDVIPKSPTGKILRRVLRDQNLKDVQVEAKL
jgi:4-coumarate--CoA ligase